VVDGSVLALIQQCLKAGVLEELKGWQPTERGTPQGAVISPLLANLHLDPLDHELERRGWAWARYADDFVVRCPSREEAEAVLNYLRNWTTGAGLTLHPTKTRRCAVSAIEDWRFPVTNCQFRAPSSGSTPGADGGADW
jgi:RNA-directed DNA polymerase